jgi:hypothetical protein
MRRAAVLVVAVLALIPLVFAEISAAQEPAPATRAAAAQPATDSLEVLIRQRYQLLPGPILRTFTDKRIAYAVTASLGEYGFEGQPGSAEDWSRVPGVFLAETQPPAIVVAKTYQLDSGPHAVTADEAAALFYHLVGEAYDWALDYPSSTTSFRSAYDADRQAIPSGGALAESFSDFLQAGDHGPRQAFARSIALQLWSLAGGAATGPSGSPTWQDFPAHFPRVSEHTGQLLAQRLLGIGAASVTSVPPLPVAPSSAALSPPSVTSVPSEVSTPSELSELGPAYLAARQSWITGGTSPAYEYIEVNNGGASGAGSLPRNLQLLPPGLGGSSGAAMLHVDVPDGARVTIVGPSPNMRWETQSRNWSRYRHYRIVGLDPYKASTVWVEVTLDRDLAGCKQQQHKCSKYISLKAGDNESLRFGTQDFQAMTTDSCQPADADADASSEVE